MSDLWRVLGTLLPILTLAVFSWMVGLLTGYEMGRKHND